MPTSPEGLRTLLRRCLEAGHLLELGLAGAALLLPIDDPARRQALAAIDAAGR